MANPLDYVTQPMTEDDYVRSAVQGDASMVDPNATVITVQPENSLSRKVTQPENPLAAMIQKFRDYVESINVVPDPTSPTGEFNSVAGVRRAANEAYDRGTGNRLLDKITGAGGEERFQFWPERMVRSGVSLPRDVAIGEVQMWDPRTGHTSEQAIERAQDTAGLAGGSILFEKPGVGTLGSGPMRRTKMEFDHPNYEIIPSDKNGPGTHQIYNKNSAYQYINGERKIVPSDPSEPSGLIVRNLLTKEDKFFPGTEAGEKEARKYWREQNKPVYDIVPKGTDRSGYWEPLVSFRSKKEVQDWLEQHGDKPTLQENPAERQLKAARKLGLLSDTSQPGMAIAGAANASKPAPVFYSALEHAVTNAAQDTMSPQQWAGWLKNQPGLKAEEMQWTGLGDWLAGQKDKVSKADVQRYLDEHKVEIKDVTKGVKELTPDMREVLNKEYEDMYGVKAPDDAELLEFANESFGITDYTPPTITRYSNYQLPGGENYREHLLTLPLNSDLEKLRMFAENRGIDNIKEAQQKYQELYGELPKGSDNYRSSHWDEPNVLAHVRTNERDVAGKPSLHLEEIQSDWHQAGRKEGYKGEKQTIDPTGFSAKEVLVHNTPYWEILDKDGSLFIKIHRREDEKPIDAINRAIDYRVEANQASLVPDAPFKTAWPELALKRMIRMAADEGKDRISWTPGEAQAARYDLSKQLDHVSYNEKTQTLVGEKGGRDVFRKQNISVKDLPDYVGKEVAEKLMSDNLPPHGEVRQVGGIDLKVGGEGMKGFYDDMLPKMVEKLGKKWGVKVKTSEIPGKHGDLGIVERDGHFFVEGPSLSRATPADGHKTRKDAEAGLAHLKGPNNKVYYFDIPPEMKEAAIGKGFPLFTSGIPFPLKPVDYNPFTNKDAM